jgi:hypothetical protein
MKSRKRLANILILVKVSLVMVSADPAVRPLTYKKPCKRTEWQFEAIFGVRKYLQESFSGMIAQMSQRIDGSLYL